MFKTGLSTCGKEISKELFEEYAKAGLTEAEISISPEEHEIFDIKTIVKHANGSGVNINSYHLLYQCTNLSKKEYAREGIDFHTEDVKRGADAGINMFVVHASGDITNLATRDEFKKCAMDSIFKLAQVAESEGVTLAVENLPRNCIGNTSAEINELLDLHTNLKVCFDTNHISKEPLVDFIKNVGDKIITTHISDFDLIDEKHWMPGEGKINWQEVIKALKNINYQGVWLYELDFACPPTIKRDKTLTCKDFADNAKMLFPQTIN